ncbi:ABC transporter ATP-binding protein [Roseomonas sp. GCM10028921]
MTDALPEPLLHAQDLVRRYSMRRGLFGRLVEVRAVDGVSLTLHRGRTLGLVGESGCGKSTTGRMVLGLEVPDSGGVAFKNEQMPHPTTPEWRRLRARMAMVYQDPLGAMDRRLTIGAQIAEPLEIHNIGKRADRPGRVEALLRDVGLRADHAARYPHELSGGQRQRAVLARALATGPDLLVCDEPISALDVSIQAQVMNLLTEVQARTGVAMLFISHDLRAVRQMSHRVAVMYLGHVVEEGEPDAVLHDPAHPYAKALVSAIPHPGRRGGRIVLHGDPPNPAARPPGCAFHPRCAYAAALCAREVPPLKRRASDGRLVACHVAHGDVAPNDGAVPTAIAQPLPARETA